jgi:hypothetical protein
MESSELSTMHRDIFFKSKKKTSRIEGAALGVNNFYYGIRIS